VHLAVTDLARAIAFYSDVVGLRLAHTEPTPQAARLCLDARRGRSSSAIPMAIPSSTSPCSRKRPDLNAESVRVNARHTSGEPQEEGIQL